MLGLELPSSVIISAAFSVFVAKVAHGVYILLECVAHHVLTLQWC